MPTKEYFGSFFQMKRIEKGYTLREFCKTFKLDPGNISKMERGLLNPPSKERLEKLVEYLEIEKGSDDWHEMYDRAATVRGQIPEEILDNDELMKSLPIIFRTFRSKKVSEKAVHELIERIKKI